MQDLIAAMQVICPGFTPQAAPIGGVHVGFLDVACEPWLKASLMAAVDAAGWRQQRLHLDDFEAAFGAGLTVINVENWAARSVVSRARA